MGCHLLATSVAAISLVWPEPGREHLVAFSSAKLLLLVSGLAIVMVSHRLHLNKAWSEGRLWTELLRSLIAMKGMPGRLNHLESLRLPAWRGQLAFLSLLHQLGARGPVRELEAARAEYLSQRIAPQLKYYPGKRSAHRLGLVILQGAFYLLSASSIATVLLKLLGSGHAPSPWSALFSILLPMTAAAAISWISIGDLDRNTVVYGEMLEELERLQREITRAPTRASFSEAVTRAESLLRHETVEWYYRQLHNQGH